MNSKQKEALACVISGDNMLLTGAAGTGKSYTVAHILKWSKANRKNIGITAATGLAALNIGGKTIHSFLGIGLAKVPPEIVANKTKFKNKPLYNQLTKLDILIIDEISMIDSALLKYISEYLSLIKECPKMFGGVQVIACGDFCQLPPIGNQYCFTSTTWTDSDFTTIFLEDQIRQNGDIEFQNMLSELRWGNCSTDILNRLSSMKDKTFENGIIPTQLFPTNKLVDEINEAEFKKLPGPSITYKTTYSRTKTWCKHIPEEVVMAMNAQVMVTINIYNTSIVNGTRGVIVGLNATEVAIKLLNGETVIIPMTKVTSYENDKDYCNYMPLKLAYAISIHKSQGMTLDAIEIDIGNSIFEYGQAYVALSRARNLDSVKILNISASSFKTHKAVKAFYNKI